MRHALATEVSARLLPTRLACSRRRALARGILAGALALGLMACGGGDGADPAPEPEEMPAPDPMPVPDPVPGVDPDPDPDPGSCDADVSFDGTWAAIQQVVFERNGCTQQVCHGAETAAGALDLSTDVAYENLFTIPSTGSRWPRIEPGDKDRSFLWLKLAAATTPDADIQVAGAPMPIGSAPITTDELELIRLWIASGAPETGTVAGTEDLIDACLPEVRPLVIEPLPEPAPDEGVQFVMPPVDLAASSEQEVCFASYFDFSDQIPDFAYDPSGEFFRIRGQELRQDPQSHHLVLLYPGISTDRLDDPSFGQWTCAGGARAGEPCEPMDSESCGAGLCRSKVDEVAIGCVGYGPQGEGGFAIFQQLGGAQEAQAYIDFEDGVFAQIPKSGVVYWSSHSFNLTTEDTLLNGRLNFYFQDDQRYPLGQIFDVEDIFLADAAPYTTQTVCSDETLPRGARLFGLTSHTHEKGRRFWATLPSGEMIYENFIYNDPVKRFFDPPLEFDSEDTEDRTISYCATYNNGVNEDGSPNPETVTRASRIPDSARLTIGACTPVACAAGNVGAPCNGFDDDAACDSSPGAGDGLCDACPITGGESTQNEMFILIGQYYVDPAFPQPSADGPIFAGLASISADPIGADR